MPYLMDSANHLAARHWPGEPADIPRCSGRAKEALDAYRQRVRELQAAGQAKPDMVAFAQLRGEWTPEREHGEIEGVPIGIELQSRGEAAIVGIHQNILKGIDSIKGESCYAVCISGRYADDDDRLDENGTIKYTGEGGQNAQGQQISDQTDERASNQALIQSIDSGLPIRVLHGQHSSYFYRGLYRCTHYEYKPGLQGKMVFTFTLKPLQQNQVLAALAAAAGGTKPIRRNSAAVKPTVCKRPSVTKRSKPKDRLDAILKKKHF